MEENLPRYPHTKYEKFLTSGCRVISNQKTTKLNLVIEKVNASHLDRWKDGWTDEWNKRKLYTPMAYFICRGYNNNILLFTNYFYRIRVILGVNNLTIYFYKNKINFFPFIHVYCHHSHCIYFFFCRQYTCYTVTHSYSFIHLFLY